jgi:hypothetical protein
MRRFVRENSLSLFFLALFLAALVGQAIAGQDNYNQEEIAHAKLLHEQPETLSMGRYVVSSSFGQAVMENWQSEYLQFTLMMMATIWLLQKGSPESKELDKAGRESDEEQMVGQHAKPDSPKLARLDDWRRRVYENSLLIVMGTIWLGTWFGHSVTGWSAFNADQIEHEETGISYWSYIGSSDFWETTLQNWQSEFLAVGSMTILAVYLRQRGSPESKPVGAAHAATGVEG